MTSVPVQRSPFARLLRPGRAAVVSGLLAAAAVALAGCGTADSGVAPRRAATIEVDPAHAGRVVPRSFLGLSTVWDSVAAYAGPSARGGSSGVGALLAPIVAETGGLALRVGGDSADQAWWNPHHRPRPPTVLEDVTPETLDAVARLARDLRGPVTLDVNLALDDPHNARALAAAARRRLPGGALDTIEIGNEPDLYTRGRVFVVPGHVHLRLRKRARYGPAVYRRDVLPYLDTLAARPRVTQRLAVAGFAGPAWWPSLPGLLDAARGRVGALSAHLYALPRCGGRAPPASWWLTTTASRDRADSLAPLVALARRRGLPVRVTELNSAACGGRPGVSNSFVAALWMTDTLFALLREGVDQADVHTWAHARYALFDVARARATARPPLTGMLAFARAAPPGSRLIATGGRLGGMRVWATVDRSRTIRVALIAPEAVVARLVSSRCAIAWFAGRRGRSAWRVCPRGGRVTIALPARTIAVLKFGAVASRPLSSTAARNEQRDSPTVA
jgi:hypothetical protein